MDKRIKACLSSIAWGIVSAVCLIYGALYAIDQPIADRLYQSNSRRVDSDIVVIGIDGRSLEELGAWGTWPRGVIGDVIERLNQTESGKPAVIGLDILFSGETLAEEDFKLAQAAAAGGNVVVASSAKFQKGIAADGLSINTMDVAGFEMPYKALADVTKQGHTNIIPDGDGVIRSSLHQLVGEEERQYSFAYEIYKAYANHMELPLTKQPTLDDYGRWYIPFAGDVGDYSSGVSVVELLNGEKVPYVKDKIVLIGFYSPGAIDAYFTAINPSEKMMGVEINANIIQSFIDEEFKQTVPLGIQAVIVGILVFCVTLSMRKMNLQKSLVMISMSILGYGFLLYGLYNFGDYVMNVIYFPLAIIICYIVKVFFSYIEENLMRLAVSKRFEDYITESNIKYSKSIKELLDSFIYTITEAVDERSPHTANHTKRLVRLAEEFVGYINEAYQKGEYHECFDQQRTDLMTMSASLHDIGKLVIPLKIMDKSTRLGERLTNIEQRFELIQALEKLCYLEGKYEEEIYAQRVLLLQQSIEKIREMNRAPFISDEALQELDNIAVQCTMRLDGQGFSWLEEDEKTMLSIRRGTLTIKEREMIEYHVQMTYKLLKGISFSGHLVDVPEVARNHHEFLDGSGYPRGLSGEQLSTEVRILTILDIFEALTAKDRPYKQPMSEEKAFAILHDMVAHNKIDGELVSLLEKGRKNEIDKIKQTK